MELIRGKADRITRSDYKNTLVVWFFFLVICTYVVLSTTIDLESIYES